MSNPKPSLSAVQRLAAQVCGKIGTVLAVLAAALSLIATPAQAKAIVLHIPISISRLPPDVTSAFLTCRLFNQSGDEMARTLIWVPLIDGGFQGHARARFLPSGYPLSADPIPDVAGYSCRMDFRWICTSSTGSPGQCERRLGDGGDEGDRASDELFRRDRTKVQVFEIEGSINPANARELPRRFN